MNPDPIMAAQDSATKPSWTRLIPTAFVLWIVIAMIRLIWVMMHPNSAARILGQTTSHPEVLFVPGRSAIAFHVFVIVSAILPIVWLAANIWMPNDARKKVQSLMPAATQRRYALRDRLSKGLLYIWICATLGLTGWSYQALSTDVTLTIEGLAVRSGSTTISLPWSDIREMSLELQSFRQKMEVGDDKKFVQIDLSAFNVPDRGLLIQQISRIAGLRRMRQRDATVVTYRKPAIPDSPTTPNQ